MTEWTGIVLNVLMFDGEAVERFMAFFDERGLPRPEAVDHRPAATRAPSLGIFAGRYIGVMDPNELESAFRSAGWAKRSNACLVLQHGDGALRVLTP